MVVRREQLMYGAGIAAQAKVMQMYPGVSPSERDKLVRATLIAGPTSNMEDVIKGIKKSRSEFIRDKGGETKW